MKKFIVLIVIFACFVLMGIYNFSYQEDEITYLTIENQNLKATVYQQKIVLNFQKEQLDSLKKFKFHIL